MNEKRFYIADLLFALAAVLYLFVFMNEKGAMPIFMKALPIGLLTIRALAVKKGALIVGALLFSMAGDVVSKLELAQGLPFLLQISFFALAHICYILEWSKSFPSRKGVAPALLLFFLGGYAMLLLGNLLATIYTRRADKRKLIIGAALFIFSDSLILVRVLCGSFPTMEFLIMGSYYSAQYLLTFSHRP